MKKKEILYIGLDIGSTTAKIAIIEQKTKKLLDFTYIKHETKQAQAAIKLLRTTHENYPDHELNIAVCGSGGKTISEQLQTFYVQEVIANNIFIKEKYPQVNTAIELGGQDAKIIFFTHDNNGKILSSDMRMNNSCAGGTGAFIEEISSLLDIPLEKFNTTSAKGTKTHPISGRCGVFAKTDIQPLLNQGAKKEDITRSSLHALAKQTIGGLAQGMTIKAPIIFEGGPFHFIPELIEVFKEKLDLKETDIINPPHSEVAVAYGAALAIEVLFKNKKSAYTQELLDTPTQTRKKTEKQQKTLFKNEKDKAQFYKRHKKKSFQPSITKKKQEAYLGIDVGSTTSKFVLLNKDEEVIYKYYTKNKGKPLEEIKKGLLKLQEDFLKQGGELNILAVGCTGYGGELIRTALDADLAVVETIAHAKAAKKENKEVSFILDVGGQDMKAIQISDGIITSITLNEACSAGCGSFIETYADTLQIAAKDIAAEAFTSTSPAQLGSRCTVFMNSSIITEQKEGKTKADILAGLCNSIIENIFTKVVRLSNIEQLGKHIIVQGGTFLNDAILKSFENYTQKKVIRPQHSGEMGAIGAALLAKEQEKKKTSFIGFEKLKKLDYTTTHNNYCKYCTNNCNRTIITFKNKSQFITGNKCEKGLLLEPDTKKLQEIQKKIKDTPNLVKERERLFFQEYKPTRTITKKNIRIGIPKTLHFWRSYPFWNALFTTLGFDVILSKGNNQESYEKGLFTIPSDTVCYPAKIVHGQIFNLEEQGVDRIFMPNPSKDISYLKNMIINEACPVLQGYPITIRHNVLPTLKKNIILDTPTFNWFNKKSRDKQLKNYLQETFSLPKKEIEDAIKKADTHLSETKKKLQERGREVLQKIRNKKRKAIVLAARPYQYDSSVNQNIADLFIQEETPVLTIDSLPQETHPELKKVRPELVNEFHAEVYNAALQVAEQPNLELVQLVSFGCGHDAIISDELVRILKETANKQPLILKLDESDVTGPLTIRIKSYIETTKEIKNTTTKKLPDPYQNKFRKQDKKNKTILVPALNESFTIFGSSILNAQGYKTKPLEHANKRAIELGKKYVHNDICFPAQINIGEALAEIEKGEKAPKEISLMLTKRCTDCREVNYPALARKALDDAGYQDVSLLTTVEKDSKDMHPGFNLRLQTQVKLVWALILSDSIELLSRRIRPYEKNKGETNKTTKEIIKELQETFKGPIKKTLYTFEQTIKRYNNIPLQNIKRKPRVLIVGELLLHVHPSANYNIETYLEEHGMEIVPAPVFNLAWLKTYDKLELKNTYDANYGFLKHIYHSIQHKTFERIHKKINTIMKTFKFYEPTQHIKKLSTLSSDVFETAFISGEGWLIYSELKESAEKGVKSGLILQPFGCLPNHVIGRGITKHLKKQFPEMQILSLDFDPDTSLANIENRLQMLILNAK